MSVKKKKELELELELDIRCGISESAAVNIDSNVLTKIMVGICFHLEESTSSSRGEFSY